MKLFIPTYIINTDENFEKWIRKQPFYIKAGVIFLKNSEEFFNVYNEQADNFQYRLLFHPGLSGNNIIEEKDLIDVKTIHNSFHSKKQFKNINIPIISRSTYINYINRQEFENKATYIKLYSYIAFDATKNSGDNFIRDIPVFSKKDNSINEVKNKKEENITKPEITIITALTEDEYESFRDNVNVVSKINGIIKVNFIKKDNYKFDYNETIGLLRQKNKMGSVESALTTNKAFSYGTDIVVMSGVCGGRKSKVNLYDIIIADQVIDIISGKYKTNNFISYGYQEPVNEDLIEFLSESNRKDEIKDRMYSLIPNSDKEKNKILNELEIEFGPIACGPFVLKSEGFLEDKSKEINDKIIGFEMESYGVIRATKLLNQNNKLSLVVKSVMDFTDENKEDIVDGENVKANAAYMSYLCVRVLIPYLDEFYRENLI